VKTGPLILMRVFIISVTHHTRFGRKKGKLPDLVPPILKNVTPLSATQSIKAFESA